MHQYRKWLGRVLARAADQGEVEPQPSKGGTERHQPSDPAFPHQMEPAGRRRRRVRPKGSRKARTARRARVRRKKAAKRRGTRSQARRERAERRQAATTTKNMNARRR